MLAEELWVLVEMVAGVDRTKAIVNVGTYFGASSAALLVGMEKYGVEGPLYCVGTFRYHGAGGPGAKPLRERSDVLWSERFVEDTKRNLMPFSVGRDVRYRECFSDDFDLSVVEGLSLVLIDGDHSVHGCLLDALKFSQVVVVGGVMLFHDYTNFESVEEAVGLFTMIRPDFALVGVYGTIAVIEKRSG